MKVFGHRGAAGLATENTLESVDKALSLGVDGIEFDVHLSRDGEMPLYHDHELVTPEGAKHPIRNLFLDEIKHFRPETITLDEALSRIDGKTEALVEIKEKVDPLPICEKLATYQNQGHAVSVLSFDYRVLRQVKEHHPDLPLVVNEEWSSLRAIWRAKRLGTYRMQLNQKWLWRGVLQSLHRRNYQVAPYTINDPGRIAKWQPYLYGVISDRPDLFTTPVDKV